MSVRDYVPILNFLINSYISDITFLQLKIYKMYYVFLGV